MPCGRAHLRRCIRGRSCSWRRSLGAASRSLGASRHDRHDRRRALAHRAAAVMASTAPATASSFRGSPGRDPTYIVKQLERLSRRASPERRRPDADDRNRIERNRHRGRVAEWFADQTPPWPEPTMRGAIRSRPRRQARDRGRRRHPGLHVLPQRRRAGSGRAARSWRRGSPASATSTSPSSSPIFATAAAATIPNEVMRTIAQAADATPTSRPGGVPVAESRAARGRAMNRPLHRLRRRSCRPASRRCSWPRPSRS